jgi:thiamine-phosphate pyrophosphorylase
MTARFDPALYAIVDILPGDDGPTAETVARAVAGGVTLVQLRGKGVDPRRLYFRARELRRTLDPLGIPLIVNDRPDVARAAGAAGVHLGQRDLPPEAARRAWPEGLIGVSVHTPEELRRAVAAGADYVASGALFGTGSKGDATPLDHADFRAIAAASPVPVVGIGGIEPGNAGVVAALGAAGIAVIRGLWSAGDVSARAAEYRDAFAAGLPRR